MPSPPRAVIALLAALLLALTACGGTAQPEASNGLPRELGAPSEVLTADEAPPPLDGPDGGDAPPGDEPSGDDPVAPPGSANDPAQPDPDQPGNDAPGDPPPPPAAEPPPDPPAPARGFRAVGNVTDGRGDHGREGPDYADIVAVTIEDDGVRARVTVDVAGQLPQQLGGGEVMGVGVDFWRNPSQPDSDFQLFATGEDDGWFAYLHTPEGFVEYPGQFRIGGSRLVFEVPWDSLGGMQSGAFRTFVDWSQRRLVLNAVSQDFAPNEGTARFSR